MSSKASAKRFNFTKASIDTLELPPSGKRCLYHDTRRPELGLRVTSTGARTFCVVKRVAGKPEWMTLGSYPTMTIEQARAAATKLLAKIVEGANPAQARRALAEEATVDEFFLEFWNKHASRNKSAKDYEQRYRDHVKPTIGRKKLSAVTRGDVEKIVERMETAGSAGGTINRVLALIQVMFNKAAYWGSYEGQNPVKGIERKSENERARFLRGNEAGRFFRALEGEPEQWRHFFSLSLLLGQRRANTLAMRWEEIDFVENVWRIPETKNGQAHEVPLTDDALTILQLRHLVRGESPFVFPGSGKRGHLAEPKDAWARILKRASLEDLNIHDLRRTLGSWQAKAGVNLVTISKTLGHKQLKTTMIYARLDQEPVRQAMQEANDALKKAAMASLTLGIEGTDERSDAAEAKTSKNT